MAKLTDKQKLFIDEYLVDLNKKQAAIRAGYSPKTADRIAAEVFQKPHVVEYYKKRIDAIQRRTEVTADKVITELAKVAFANGTDYAQVVYVEKPTPFFNKDGLFMGFRPELQPEVAITATDKLETDKKSAVSGIKRSKNGIEVSSYDKLRALELLGKHFGVFNDGADRQATADNNLLEAIKEAANKMGVEDEDDEI